MHAIDLMVSEHRLIEQVLDALADFGRRAVAGEPVEADRLNDIVAFLRGYADALHHGKEEAILFAALRQQGCPPEFEPVLAAICRDHEVGRNLVDDLDAAQRRPKPWTAEVCGRIGAAASDFVSLLAGHIQREDREVFPTAQELLDEQWTQRVEDGCVRFERDHAERREELERIAAKLTA